jgi:hypothetical protein
MLHLDFMYMGASEDGSTYLLLKDDAGKYVLLANCVRAGASDPANVLLSWFALFGVVRAWVPDQGSHFKNDVIRDLQHVLGAHHHFVTALSPWANGPVEAANRAVLRVFPVMLAEWKIPTNAWPRLTPLVQMVLNNTPVDSLGGKAPITPMTGRELMGQLDPLVWRLDAEPTSLDEMWIMPRSVRFAADLGVSAPPHPWRWQPPSIDAGGRKSSPRCPISKWGISCWRRRWQTLEGASYRSCGRGRCASPGPRARGLLKLKIW